MFEFTYKAERSLTKVSFILLGGAWEIFTFNFEFSIKKFLITKKVFTSVAVDGLEIYRELAIKGSDDSYRASGFLRADQQDT